MIRAGGMSIGGATGSLNPAFNSWLNSGPSNVSVYLGLDNSGNAVYVGITNNIQRRQQEHGSRFSRLEEVHSGLTRNQARSVEQVYIRDNQHFQNMRNEISSSNQHYQDAIGWAENYLGK